MGYKLADKDFNIVLSNPRLDPYETTNVSPPRLDAPNSTAVVRILSMAGLGEDPNQNTWTAKLRRLPLTMCIISGRGTIVCRGTSTITSRRFSLGVFRTHRREPGTGNDWGATLTYRVNGKIGDNVSPQDWNNFFALNPGSEYAIPRHQQCVWRYLPVFLSLARGWDQRGTLSGLGLYLGRRHGFDPGKLATELSLSRSGTTC